MKVCFYGNTGHFFTAVVAKSRLPQMQIAGYCPSYPGESMDQLRLFCGKVKGEYPDGWEIHARNGGGSVAFDPVEYTDLDVMLQTERPDVLVVDNRFAERYLPEKKALEAGCHVYADKPIAIREDELLDLYETVKRTGKTLWAMDTVRYDAWYDTARKLVNAGKIGKIRMVNCQKSYRLGKRLAFYGERKYYGGTIPWVTIHSIDMIRMITGKEMRSVYSVQNRADNGGYGDMEAITASVFELEDDILATVQTDYYRPENTHSHDDDRLRVVGTEGILEVIRGSGEHEVRLINKDFNGVVPQEQPPFIFEDFVHTIEGGGTGQLDVDESFRNAYAAICAQRAADTNSIVSMRNAKELFTMNR